jgi:hypothetical protein
MSSVTGAGSLIRDVRPKYHMETSFRFLIGLVCAFATVAHVQAQGTIVPNGITYSSAGLTAVIHVQQSPTNSDYAGFGLRPRFTTPPQVYVTIFSFDLHPGESVRAFLVSSNDPISLQAIQAGSYLEMASGGLYGFDLDIPFYLGFYTGSTNAMPAGIYSSPVFGWGEFVNSGGVIQMLDAALVAGGDGIYVGTQSIISVPEPGVLSLVSVGAFLFVFCGKRSNKVTAANAGWRTQFRFRGSRHRPGVAEFWRSASFRTLYPCGGVVVTPLGISPFIGFFRHFEHFAGLEHKDCVCPAAPCH